MFREIAKQLRCETAIREPWSRMRRGRCGEERGLLGETLLQPEFLQSGPSHGLD